MGRALQIDTPRSFLPLLEPSRYKGAYGGRGSGKSWTFATLLIETCLLRLGLRAVCVREIQRTLEQSVKRLLEDRIQHYELSAYFDVQHNQIGTPGGGVIIFEGMANHTAESIKSLEGYDVAWVEEAHMLSQRSLDLLRPTIRKAGSELWFSWNPRSARDPVDNMFRGKDGPPPGAVIVKANWDDNPWFPAELQSEMEWDRGRDPEKYAHIWLGDYEQTSEARVFKNWRVDEFDTEPGTTFYFGADWGFAVDPTVLVRCWLDGRTLYVDREVYRVGCEIDATPALFDTLESGMARKWTVTADSARPETISYMQRHGYPKIKAAKKGAGSVEEGIAFLQSYDIVVHQRCQHTIDELTLYRYKTDPLTGAVLPILEDKKNHVIDALRYAVEAARKVMREVKIPEGLTQASAWKLPEPEAEKDPGLKIPVPSMHSKRRSQWSYDR